MPEAIRPLDATDQTQILEAVRSWLNSHSVLPSTLNLEYVDGLESYCIKCDGGEVVEQDILDNFIATISFSIYYYTNAVPKGTGSITKPLDELVAWIRKNDVLELSLGARREPYQIFCTKMPSDTGGPDPDGNVTFFTVFTLWYAENNE